MAASFRTGFILTCAIGVVLAGAGSVWARVWTSSDGRYTINANFVKLEEGVVTLQTPGKALKEMTIALSKLSALDQHVARQLASAKRDSVTLEIVGVGLSPEEALNDAFRNAVQKVVGSMIDSTTVVENDVLAQDRVLVFSDGFVRDYEDLGSRRKEGLCYRKIRANVERRDVSSADDGAGEGNARRLYAEAFTKIRRMRIGMIMLQNALDEFNAELLDAQLAKLGSPEVIPGDFEKVKVTCQVSVSINPRKYEKLQRQLVYVLGALADYEGAVDASCDPISTSSRSYPLAVELLQRKFLYGKGDAEDEGTRAVFRGLFSLANPRVSGQLPDAAGEEPRKRAATLFSVHVPSVPGATPITGATAYGDTQNRASAVPSQDAGRQSHWKWFQIPTQPHLSDQDIHIVVRYTDNAGAVVHEERLAVGPRIPGISLQSNVQDLVTVMVGPHFLYHVAKGYELLGSRHAESLHFQRTMLLSLEKLREIHSAKALVVGDRVRRRTDFTTQTDAPSASDGARASPSRDGSVPGTPARAEATSDPQRSAGKTAGLGPGAAVSRHASPGNGRKSQASDAFHRGTEHLNRKEYAAAISDLALALELAPTSRQYRQSLLYAYCGRALQLQQKHDYRSIVQLMDDAILVFPSEAVVYACRGTAHFNMRDYRRAIPDMDEAIRLDPDKKKYYLVRGNARIAIGQLKTGKQDLQRASQ
jgi:hypothetical protein